MAAEDGLLSAAYDKFVLRAKAEALVRMAEGGLSMRGASLEAPRLAIELRTGTRPLFGRVSRDGRLGRDWVSQYTEIIGRHYLPTQWPKAIVVDSFDVRNYLYTVVAAVGYAPGSYRGQLWWVGAY